MKIVDLSHALFSGMPIYPGDSAPRFCRAATLEKTGYRDMEFTFGSHLGTHLDAPAHVLEHGKTLDRLTIERFFGSACCLDLSDPGGPLIDSGDLYPFREIIVKSDFILLRTGWNRFWGTDAYFRGYPTLSLQAATWLAALPLKGIGIDAASLDNPEEPGLAVHRILLERDICLIENLTGLDQLPAEGFLFSCLPLKLREGDASPVRAAAILS